MALKRKNGIPLYIQIKDSLKKNIESGKWGNGFRLPSERDLAEKLEVSRNTVSMAVKELELEGLVSSQQGKGAFVIDAESNSPLNRKEQLLFLMDKFIDQALDLDFDLEKLDTFFRLKLIERRNRINEVQVLFIDCNAEHLFPFIDEVRTKSKVRVEFMLLDDFLKKAKPAFLKSFELIATTMTHIEEIRNLAGNTAEVIGISTTPNLEIMVRLARLKNLKAVGVAAGSKKYAASLERALERAGLSDYKLKPFISDGTNLEKFVTSNEIIITSRPLEEKVRKEAGRLNLEREIIPFFYDMEKGSLDSILRSIDGLKKGRKV